MKRFLSVVLSLLMVMTTIAALPFAANALEPSGQCGENATYTFDSKTGTLTISGTGAIDSYAFFSDSDVENIIINEGITEIGSTAFYNFSKLNSVFIPKTVESISENPFYWCSELTSVIVDNDNPKYDSRNNCNAIIETSTNKLITGCKTTVIPDDIEIIGYSSFDNCRQLENITIPKTVKTIEDYAFRYCSFESVTIPDSVNSIGKYAFCDNNKINELTIGNSVTSIGKSAFKGCSNLTSATIGNSVTTIGEEAFNGCTSLTDVYYSGTKEQWDAITIGSSNSCLTDATIHLHTHSYNTIVTNPTCTAKGYTTHTCECGDSFVDTYVNALGHKSDKGTVTKKATYTATGVKTYKCTVCGKVLKTETIAKLPKKANTLVAKGKTATVKFANLKKKNQTVTQKNAFTVSKAQGKVTYKKASGNGKITVNSAGKFTVKKGLKKGTYKIKVKVTAAGNTTYKAVTKTVTVTIKVK
ncbi:MAG: leucine-rich repeat domain-containing protein [Eubacterium sp.]|nr:leucine-rich repeat domain-containing protein [Eubacterium sp.]